MFSWYEFYLFLFWRLYVCFLKKQTVSQKQVLNDICINIKQAWQHEKQKTFPLSQEQCLPWSYPCHIFAVSFEWTSLATSSLAQWLWSCGVGVSLVNKTVTSLGRGGALKGPFLLFLFVIWFVQFPCALFHSKSRKGCVSILGIHIQNKCQYCF